MQAFILIHTELGRAEEVASEVHGLRKVLNSEAVTGPYDVIAQVEIEALDEVYDELIPAIRDIPGVMRSVTCPSVGHRYAAAEAIAA